MISRILTLTTALTLLASPIVSQAKDLIPYVSDKAVAAIDVDNKIGTEIRLDHPSHPNYIFRDLEFSPDQERLAYIEATPREDFWWIGRIKIGRLANKQRINYEGVEGIIADCDVQTEVETPRNVTFYSLDWSLDGERIIADGVELGTDKGVSLYLINPEDGSVRTLFNSGELCKMSPSWGPNQKVYCIDSSSCNGFTVYDLKKRKNSKFLDVNLEIDSFDVSSHGLVFASDDETGSSSIYLSDFDGNVRRLVDNGEDNVLPRWTSDGKIFYFGETDIYTVDPERNAMPRKFVQGQ